jgi:hypothetical protein
VPFIIQEEIFIANKIEFSKFEERDLTYYVFHCLIPTVYKYARGLKWGLFSFEVEQLIK